VLNPELVMKLVIYAALATGTIKFFSNQWKKLEDALGTSDGSGGGQTLDKAWRAPTSGIYKDFYKSSSQ
jgi:hypothetical protein